MDVITTDIRPYISIDLDELVSRINAGAEAEARAERAEKALEKAMKVLKEFTRAQYPVSERITASGNGWRTWELDGTYKKAKALLSKYEKEKL